MFLQQSDPLLQKFKLEQVEEDEEDEEEEEHGEHLDHHHASPGNQSDHGSLVMDIDASPRGWRERSESPHGRVSVVPADHLELADTMLDHPTIDMSTEAMHGHGHNRHGGHRGHETNDISCN